MRIRITIVSSLLLLLASATHAQTQIGFKVGPDFSKLLDAVEGSDNSDGVTVQPTGTHTSIYGSLFANIPLDKKNQFYIRPQVEYIGGGGNLNSIIDYNSNGLTPNTKYVLKYVDVPVQFIYSPTLGDVKPFVGFGLYGGALVSGTAQDNATGDKRTLVVGSKSSDDVQRFDFGYLISFGLTTKPGIFFGVDYQQGFVRVVPQGPPGSTPRLHTRNSMWGLNIGYMFTL